MKTSEPGGNKRGNFILQISRGLVRDQYARRNVMFFVVLAALVLLFLGNTFLANFLKDRPALFIGYWIVCVWLTLLALLLALYDMLAVRAAAQQERRRLRRQIFDDDDDQPDLK